MSSLFRLFFMSLALGVFASAQEKSGHLFILSGQSNMTDHVKEVLADPKKVHPEYNEKEGYGIAGFVWFQGFNDMVGPYPAVDPAAGKKSVKDYSE